MATKDAAIQRPTARERKLVANLFGPLNVLLPYNRYAESSLFLFLYSLDAWNPEPLAVPCQCRQPQGVCFCKLSLLQIHCHGCCVGLGMKDFRSLQGLMTTKQHRQGLAIPVKQDTCTTTRLVCFGALPGFLSVWAEPRVPHQGRPPQPQRGLHILEPTDRWRRDLAKTERVFEVRVSLAVLC